jgi:Serine hydrolase (FSH1)
MAMQMAAMQANMKRFSFVYINAPLPAKGEPDVGIAMFYPDQPYYEWFYRIDDSSQSDDIKSPSSTDASSASAYSNIEINGEDPSSSSSSTTLSSSPSPSPRFEGMEETMRYLVEHILNHGPYDGYVCIHVIYSFAFFLHAFIVRISHHHFPPNRMLYLGYTSTCNITAFWASLRALTWPQDWQSSKKIFWIIYQ